MARLYEKYKNEIISALKKDREYPNVMAVPKITKIVLNMGVGKAIENKKLLDTAVDELSMISGQRAIKTKARKSISNFKIREGYQIGCKVTLRGKKMYEFLDRLVNIALPRVRDFKGISGKSFDGRGNYSLGIKEQIIFPEIDYDKVERIWGLDVTIVTTANTDEEAKALLKYFGMPFRN
jgi:large subunit ribosomal protein L5